MTTIKINVYRACGREWYAARWIDGDYDGCDALDVPDDADDDQAIEAARTMSLNIPGEREICRVSDIQHDRL